MLVIPERMIVELMTPEYGFNPIVAVFAAMGDGAAYNFPVLREALGEVAAELGLPFEALAFERMVEADVIITITSAPAFLLSSAHVSPGTHSACMGSDTIGKQEVEPTLLARACSHR